MKKIFNVLPFLMLLGSLNAQKMTFNKENYAQAWQEIDSLTAQSLPKSALEKVEALYAVAKKDNNPTQITKALLHRARFMSEIEEDGYVKAYNMLNAEAETATFPTKSIVESVLGTLLSDYLSQQYWQIRNRSASTLKLDDVRTWDIDKLNTTAQQHFLASVADPQLVQVPVNEVDALTTEHTEEADVLQPTLFDLLAHRALAYFQNERSYLNAPTYKFYLDTEGVFGDAQTFMNLSFDTRDTTSGKLQAVLLLQRLMQLHKEGGAAFDYLDLMRLDFAYQNAVVPNKKTLYFNALEAMAKRFENNPMILDVAEKIANFYMADAAKYDPAKRGMYKDAYQKAHKILSDAVAKYPTARGAKACKSKIKDIENQTLTFEIEKVHLPEKPILTKVTFRNTEKAYFRIVRVNESYIRRNFRDDSVHHAHLMQCSVVQTKMMNLPQEHDFHTYSTELKLEKLPIGLYVVMLSDNENFSFKKGDKINFSLINVSNLAFWSENEADYTKMLVVVNRATGAPMPNVSAVFFAQKYNDRKQSYEYIRETTQLSDAQGFVKPQGLSEKRNYNVRLIQGKDTLYSDEDFSGYRYKKEKTVSQQVRFFLDRAIYRPSQTVYFKGIALEFEDEKPHILTNKEVTVEFVDANNQVIAKQNLRTNEYGTFNGTFTAPSTGLMGQMFIRSSLGSIYFRVEEYKRPKFEVKMKPLEGDFVLNQKILVKGNAKAYAGSNIDGAKVKYRVTRSVRYPYYWWGWQATEGGQEIAFGEIETDAAGAFVVPFVAMPDKSVAAEGKPVFDYQIRVDVTDISGETHSANTSVSLGYVSTILETDIEDRLLSSQKNAAVITVKNLNDSNLKAEGEAKLDLLASPKRNFVGRYWDKPTLWSMTAEEYKLHFPNITYGDEFVREKWAVAKAIFTKKFETTTEKGDTNVLQNVHLAALEAGIYRLTLTTKDVATGEVLTVVKHFEVVDFKDKKAPFHTPLLSILDRNTVSSNTLNTEGVNLLLATTETKLPVLFEIERKNKVVRREWLTLNDARTMRIALSEEDRGNIGVHLTFVRNNRIETVVHTIQVPYSNKDLTVEFGTFRDKMQPGSDENWQIKISGSAKEKVAAEMMATMYDASLDAFAKNSWLLNLYMNNYNSLAHTSSTFGEAYTQYFSKYEPEYFDETPINFRELNLFDLRLERYYDFMLSRVGIVKVDQTQQGGSISADELKKMPRRDLSGLVSQIAGVSSPPPPPPAPNATMRFSKAKIESKVTNGDGVADSIAEPLLKKEAETAAEPDFSTVKARTNLNETVFFFPSMQTDSEGNIVLSFKMNEALTRWRFMALAHTTDLKVGYLEKEVVTQKDLMVFPNAPRFLREGDNFVFSGKVSNLSGDILRGGAKLQLFDAISMQPIDNLLGNDKATINFEVKAGESAPLMWALKIPYGKVQAVTYRIVAKAGDFSDGEENTLPVLTNRMLVTETLPMTVRGGETKTFTIKPLQKIGTSNTLAAQRLTLEFTQNPAWYAVQALPYLMEYPYECTEQVFSRFYANSLATSVANAHPRVKAIFDRWRTAEPAALESNLSKNQELKTALLEETPWVLEAQNEATQKKNIALLFDLNRMANEQKSALNKISKRQLSNGGFAWFDGGRDDWYITQYLVNGFAHLKSLNVMDKSGDAMLEKAIAYCDNEATKYFEELKEMAAKGRIKLEDDHISGILTYYFYANSGLKRTAPNKELGAYFEQQAKKYWTKKDLQSQAHLALILHRSGDTDTPKRIIKSLRERAINDEERGMFWKNELESFYIHPLETHALMIELFAEITNDTKTVDDLKLFLLKNKQTNAWKTTKATAEAVYALLKTGSDWLADDKNLSISIGDKPLDLDKINREAGTGYFKTAWSAAEITPEMSKIVVENPNKVAAWGAAYFQYFEDLDKIKDFRETPLKISKTLMKQNATETGIKLTPLSTDLKVGDKVTVRMELRVDRPMQYVHLKDMRAAGFEPTSVLSRYKWQDGLGYYESTRDMATHFFISYLPKGVYVLEYEVVVTHQGDFSNGITTFQCMYAPEFSSHTEGVRVKVNE